MKRKQIEGEKLAKVYCASCHLFPEPSVLQKDMWVENILPNMGHKMGMTHHGPIYYDLVVGENEKKNPAILSQDQWEKIVLYYMSFSPEKESPKLLDVLESTSLFEPYLFSNDSISNEFITLIKFDTIKRKLFIGDGKNLSLEVLNIHGDIIETEKLKSPPVKLVYKDSIRYLLTIGELNPSDDASGKLYVGNRLVDSLIRPVDFLVNDVDADGFEDVFVCNYGNSIGDFSLYHNIKDEQYKKEILYPSSGAIKVAYENMDDDDALEIVVLFAQEHETLMIWDYENGNFKGNRVLQFQPAFGSVDFQLCDIDSDGDNDIILCNGDNADLSLALKNYHGVYVFLNEGRNKFEQSYFYPMHGASKLSVGDFDLDKDLDILLISNFGNFSDPNFKSVQFLENKGNMKFNPKSIAKLPNSRWQTLNVSDYDLDGDLDVFIGAFNLDIGPKESYVDNKDKISWVKLENRTR
jgi:hypothetical protein